MCVFRIRQQVPPSARLDRRHRIPLLLDAERGRLSFAIDQFPIGNDPLGW